MMTNNKIIYQVDAFTDEVFKGNPAGVMIVDGSVSEKWMQDIALEMNLSETAFVIPHMESFDIRYFTPAKEVPICGHATLASAHIMYQLGLKKAHEPIHFKTKIGDLTVSIEGGDIVMVFPKFDLQKIEKPGNLEALVGFKPLETFSSNEDWVIAVAENEQAVKNVHPNFEALLKNDLGHLMVTAKSNREDVDFVVRCFAPSSGINEDPVTGSAHCALTPLWSEKLGKMQMTSHQISKRGGILKVALVDGKVKIKGKAITVFEAQLKV